MKKVIFFHNRLYEKRAFNEILRYNLAMHGKGIIHLFALLIKLLFY